MLIDGFIHPKCPNCERSACVNALEIPDKNMTIVECEYCNDNFVVAVKAKIEFGVLRLVEVYDA